MGLPTKKNDISIDALLENLDISKLDAEKPGPKTVISFWVGLDEHAAFKRLQEKTRGGFGKVVKDMVLRAIEKADGGTP